MQKNQKCLTTLGAEKQREEQSNLFVKKNDTSDYDLALYQQNTIRRLNIKPV